MTGGTGYIGSHTCLHLLEQGNNVTILDNLSNSSPLVVGRIESLINQTLTFLQGDLRDTDFLQQCFASKRFDAVIHFAGLKSVAESVIDPVAYYDNNVVGTVNLLKAMQGARVMTLVFSSSATVYGDSPVQPIDESLPFAPTNPYGNSKSIIETILKDLATANAEWRIACLRYFNPVGAHSSGRLGEDPSTPPNNLMPFVGQVALGKRECLSVFGNDYPTGDGTGVRDYIHVMDLAEGHAAALDWLQVASNPNFAAINLGTGKGSSVLELVRAFEVASSCSIPYKIVARRPGDVACCFANVELAARLLHWKASRGINQMCADTWRWLSNNPQGYL